MSAARSGPAAAVFWSLLKRICKERATAQELADEAGTTADVARAWARAGRDEQILKSRLRTNSGAKGPAPEEFTLASRWRDL